MQASESRRERDHDAIALRGRVRVVADKSLTHRGAILAALTRGRTVLSCPNGGADCRATLRAVERLGAQVLEDGPDRWVVESEGRLREPEDVLDLGNSGTGIRLLAGVAAGIDGLTVLTGDASLRRRPMGRIAVPLARMGAAIETRAGHRAPLVVRGGRLRGIEHVSPVPSAQVKSALLLAGLALEEGAVLVEEPVRSRDHTERLLRYYGADLAVEGTRVRLAAAGPLEARSWSVPGDVSAAAFFVAGALLVPGSEIVVEDVGLNPTRTGALDVLARMGGEVEAEVETEAPEPVGRIRARASALRATVVEPHEVPRLVDEIPILALAAGAAEGVTEFRGIGELRHKESDRVATTVALLAALGIEAEAAGETLRVGGRGPDARFSPARIHARGDHRIAMTGWIASLRAEGPVEVDSREMIATSDPTFFETLAALTGTVRP